MSARRSTALALALVAALAGVARANATVRAVGAIGITVADLDAAVRFYRDVLDFEPRGGVVELAGADAESLQGVFGVRMRVATLALGGATIELTEYLAPRGRAFPAHTRANDRWFQHAAIVVSDMERAYARLRVHGVEHASSGPQRLPDWNPNAGGIEAFYFKDPDGHALEVLQFPAGKGDPKWHQPSRRLFLGIDHTAIVVGDTDSSLRFYRDTLGLRVAGESTNYGPEQERLNSVFGARLRITGLKAAKGPGVEFLEYLAPRNGRLAAGIQPNDLAHWETTVTTADEDLALERFVNERVMLISPAVALFGRPLDFVKGLLVQDPDGHAVKVVQR